MQNFKDIVYKQLAIDYCLDPDELAGTGNCYHTFKALPGRRRFQQDTESFLRIAVIKNRLLFAGDPRIIDWCRQKYEKEDGAWFFEPQVLRELDHELARYGYGVDHMHPFYTSGEPSDPTPCPYEIRIYRGGEIEEFRGDKRFTNAFTFKPEAPDMIGIAALNEGKIIGMAGASADSPIMWQIGIDVLPDARGQGVGVMLVERIRNEILKEGVLPYYGADFSHMVSQNIAIRSGFTLAFAELTAEKLAE